MMLDPSDLQMRSSWNYFERSVGEVTIDGSFKYILYGSQEYSLQAR